MSESHQFSSQALEPGQAQILLQAQEVQARMGAHLALQGVSLTLPRGQWVSVVGPNGAGKSTLLATLAGLRPLESGAVMLEGRPIQAWDAQQRASRLAWLPQHWDGEGELTCQEVVSLGRLPHRGLLQPWTAQDQERVRAMMHRLGVHHLCDRPLGALSGGERQRVLLSRVWCVGAPLVLLDEPTTHLDPPHLRQVLQLGREQVRQGVCLVTVLHDLTTALQADRVLVMAQGRVVADAAPGSPDLEEAVDRVFAGAVEIAQVNGVDGPRWVAWTR